jgi:osmotically-inducible protein OsmY
MDSYNENAQNDGSHTDADWKVTAAVKKAFMTDSDLSMSARFVSVSTDNGTVTLTGSVSSKEESRKLERRAKSVSGVRSVNNQLTISE